MRNWNVTTNKNICFAIQASDAMAAITYVVAIQKWCEHKDIVSVEEVL